MDTTNQQQIITIVRSFNAALNRADVAGMMALVSEDFVFENTYPPPDGEKISGKEQNRIFWADFFRGSSAAHIDIEEIFANHDRCIMRWTYRWADGAGKKGHIRGIDLYQVENGLIREKLSYVKG